jgi:hypothetical protein
MDRQQHQREMSRNGALTGSYALVKQLALSGAEVLKLQIKAPASQTATATNAVICALKASAFEAVEVAESAAETSRTASTLSAKNSLAASLTAGMYHLLLVDGDVYIGDAGSAAGCDIEIRRNGVALHSGIRFGARSDATWAANSLFSASIIAAQQTTDTIELMFASRDGVSEVKLKEATIIALALKDI